MITVTEGISLAAQHRQLKVWAANCPENFGKRTALLGAEVVVLEAGAALRSEHANGVGQDEAVAVNSPRAFTPHVASTRSYARICKTAGIVMCVRGRWQGAAPRLPVSDFQRE
jgi:hypothetical protein